MEKCVIYMWITLGKPFILLVDCLLQSSSVFCEYLCCLWNDMFVSLNNRRSEGRELLISWADVSSGRLWGNFNVSGAEDSPDLLYLLFPLPLQWRIALPGCSAYKPFSFEKCLWLFFFFFDKCATLPCFQLKAVLLLGQHGVLVKL